MNQMRMLFRLGQGPIAAAEPNLVTGQPAAGGLDGENAGETCWVPAAGLAIAPLPPQAKRLSFEQVRARMQRRQYARLRRRGWIAGEQTRFQLVDVVHRLED